MRKIDLNNYYKKACNNLQLEGLCKLNKENAEWLERVRLLEARNTLLEALIKDVAEALEEFGSSWDEYKSEHGSIKKGESCER